MRRAAIVAAGVIALTGMSYGGYVYASPVTSSDQVAAQGQAAAKSTAASAAGNPLSARAKAAGVCSDAKQVGETAYIKRDDGGADNGETVGSVRKFYSASCGETYGYLWVWQSYRDQEKTYDATLNLWKPTGDPDNPDEAFAEKEWADTSQQEFWLAGKTSTNCTNAVGTLQVEGKSIYRDGTDQPDGCE